jgi:hypothetical protein
MKDMLFDHSSPAGHASVHHLYFLQLSGCHFCACVISASQESNVQFIAGADV